MTFFLGIVLTMFGAISVPFAFDRQNWLWGMAGHLASLAGPALIILSLKCQ
jgi:hypothetical protein